MALRLILVLLAVSRALSNPTPTDIYDTIVIGLGSSGTTAASTLAKAGKKVLALEAQDRIGGRVYTVPFGDGVVEVGAEWIHGTNPSNVYDLALANNISLIPQTLDFEVFRSDGSEADKALMQELLDYCIDALETPPDKPESLGSFLTRKLKDYLKEKHPDLLENKEFLESFLEFLNLLMNNYEASNDWNDVSAYTTYEDLKGNQHTSWHRHGYKTFFDILLNKYNNGPGLPTLDIKLNTEVTKITWPQDPKENVVVTTKDGTTYTANNVIVTVSLGVLKEKHSSLFHPSLPLKKIKAIEHVSIGTIGKIIISFKENWWPNDLCAFNFIWKEGDAKKLSSDEWWPSRIFGVTMPLGATNAMTLWTNGDVSKLVETVPDEEVKTKVYELIKRFVGKKYTIPEPTGIIRSQWFSNPYTRGSYTYDNLDIAKYPTARADLATPLTDSANKPRVLFAGEATNEAHFGTVHGASETGLREAKRLLPTSSKI